MIYPIQLEIALLLTNSNASYQNKGQNLQIISITAEEYHKYSMHDYVWSVVLYNSIYLRKALLKVLCALVVSQKRRNTSYSIAKTITKSVTELCLIFSTFQLNPCSSETPDSQRKKIQTFLKLFINSLLRQGALTINFAQAFVAALSRSPNPRGFVSGGLKL